MTNQLPTPMIVTRKSLYRALLPHVIGYEWAVNALDEIWRMSTPDPQSVQAVIAGVPFEERRILMPSVFSQWWTDVQQRKGIKQTLNEVLSQ